MPSACDRGREGPSPKDRKREAHVTTDQDLQRLLDNPRFPRASVYPARWVAENQMGPNALWLTEWLCEASTCSRACGCSISAVAAR